MKKVGKIKRVIFAFLLILIYVFMYSNYAQEHKKVDLWGSLTAGQYEVGYRVAYEYDYSRTVKSKYNYQNKLITDNNFRPVQISIWYPAEVKQDSLPMPYSEYIITRESRFNYSLRSQENWKQILDKYKDHINWYNQSETKNEDITDFLINRKTKAYKNALPYRDKFPLILFCSGGGDTPDSFDILFEYLASHGYVIAAIPSNGMFDDKPAYNLMDEESQIRDMEFTMCHMRNFPSADINNICSMGYSYGGIVNVLFALRNFDIKAVLCLDGSICLKDRDQAVKNLPYFNPSQLKTPFMNMARKVHDEQDFEFYNKLKYSDAYLLHFNQITHEDFTTTPRMRDFENINSRKNKNITRIGTNTELVYRYSLHFLNAHIKDDIDSFRFIQNNPEKNGISEKILDIDFKKSLDIPPLGKNFIEYIKDNGIEKGLEVYHKAKTNDSEIILFDQNEINSLGYDFLNKGMIEDAIKVFQLFVLQYPETSNAYDSLGEAYAKNNNIKEAILNYRKALKINPYSQSAARAIKKLEKLEKENPEAFEKIAANGYCPCWSINGKYIVFGGTAPSWNIFRIDLEEKNLVQLTSGQGYHPAVSPDDSSVIYDTRGAMGTLQKISLEDGKPEILAPQPIPGNFSTWSSDGKYLIYSRQGKLWKFDTKFYQEMELFSIETPILRSTWSPDGTKIAFDSGNTRDNGNMDVYIINADGTHLQQLTDHPKIDSQPHFSPDGKWLTFMSEQSGNRDIWIMRIDGSHKIRLTYDPKMDIWPRWSPDGKKIVFGSQRNSTSEEQINIWIVNLEKQLGKGPFDALIAKESIS